MLSNEEMELGCIKESDESIDEKELLFDLECGSVSWNFAWNRSGSVGEGRSRKVSGLFKCCLSS